MLKALFKALSGAGTVLKVGSVASAFALAVGGAGLASAAIIGGTGYLTGWGTKHIAEKTIELSN